MGDWNTLHHFNDKIFYAEIVPDLKRNGQLLEKYFNSEFGKYIAYADDNNADRIAEIISFCQFLDKDFKHHKTLFEIQKRTKGKDEDYDSFIVKRNRDEDDFQKANGKIIEDINNILTLIIFSECAAFNPHLILGRRIFTGNVRAKPDSVAEEVIWNFTNRESGSIFYSSNGLINWVTHDDLQLLWLDKENLQPADRDSEKYFSDFYKFIEIAVENELGVIAGTNMREDILKLIKSPLTVKVDVKELGLENVINYE
ncbi:MAG: hypothetical protein H6581_02995 [Bacteroidia bacterium]|nr:hypothetical protein [Bacteroidia bacterium]